jgi:hypothetical protein
MTILFILSVKFEQLHGNESTIVNHNVKNRKLEGTFEQVKDPFYYHYNTLVTTTLLLKKTKN